MKTVCTLFFAISILTAQAQKLDSVIVNLPPTLEKRIIDTDKRIQELRNTLKEAEDENKSSVKIALEIAGVKEDEVENITYLPGKFVVRKKKKK
jgi:endonuclease V-like protein UPF0215 family